MAFQSRCPHCSKVLKLKSKAAFGKVAPCPQCGERFKVKPLKKAAPKPAPEPDPEDEWEEEGYDEYGYDDDYGDDDYGYDDGYDEPAPKKSSGSKKKGKKKKKKAGTPGWVIGLGIGAAAAAAIGLLVALAMFLFGGGGGSGSSASNAINLAYLPANADGYMHVRPTEMWNAPILAPLRESELVNKAMQSGAMQNMPFTPADVESATTAMVGIADLYQQRQNLFGQAMGSPEMIQKAAPKTVSVIRLSRSISDDDLSSFPGASKQDVNGHQMWVIEQGPARQAHYLVDGNTMLSGDPQLVAEAIDRGATEERVERIDFMNADHQFAMVIAPEKVIPTEGSSNRSGPGAALESSLNESAKGFSFGLSLTSDIEMEARIACRDSSGASQISGDVDTALSEIKSKFDEMTANASGGFIDVSSFIEVGRQSVDSLSVESSGELVSVEARVPGSIADAIKELTDNPFIAGMIENAVNQGAGGPPGMGMPGMGPGGPPGSGGFGTESFGPEPDESAYNTSPDAPEQSNIDAVNQERTETGEQLDGIRNRVNETTGNIIAIPGGGQRSIPSGSIGSGSDQ